MAPAAAPATSSNSSATRWCKLYKSLEGESSMLGDDWLEPLVDTLSPKFDKWLQDATSKGYWSQYNPVGELIPWNCLNPISNRYERWKKTHSRINPSKDELIEQIKAIELGMPGCYIFGWGSNYKEVVPRYVGQTGTSLVNRLHDRFISPCEGDQNPKARRFYECNYAAWLTNNGLAGIKDAWKELPSEFDELILKYFKNDGPSKREVIRIIRDKLGTSETVRRIKTNCQPPRTVAFGEDFAKFGIDNIWFALFPTTDKEKAKALEGMLILTARQWNLRNGYDDILNA